MTNLYADTSNIADVKKGLLYTSILLLYLMTALFGFAALNTMISLKYEVDEAYIVVEMNKKLSAEAKQNRIAQLDKEEKRLKFQANGLFIAAAGAFIGATAILIRRNRILKMKKK